MNPTEHKVYMCSVCGEYYHAKKQAETCCVGEKCPECGAQRYYQFSPLCNKCRQKERDRFYAEQQKARWEAARNKAVEKFNWEGVSAGQEREAEGIAVNPYFVKLASQAMDTLKTGKSCDFKPCGGSAALRMDMSAEEVSACALVAPFARRYA